MMVYVVHARKCQALLRGPMNGIYSYSCKFLRCLCIRMPSTSSFFDLAIYVIGKFIYLPCAVLASYVASYLANKL